MNADLIKKLKEGTEMALEDYCARHPSLSHYLLSCKEDITDSMVSSIEDDPGALAALEAAKAEDRLLKAVEIIADRLPSVIGLI